MTPVRDVRFVGAHVGEGPFWYTLFGLHVLSDFRLPVPAESPPTDAQPDLVFRRPAVGQSMPPVRGPESVEERCKHGSPVLVVNRDPDTSEVWVGRRELGTFHVAADYRHVDVYTLDSADEQIVGLMLAGQLTVFVLHLRGAPSLHASAIVPPVLGGGAVAFFGRNGQGKSSMAATFLHNGATLLTDDALVLQQRQDGIYGIPGPRLMKLWPSSVRHTLDIEHSDLPDLLAKLDKKLLTIDGHYSLAEAPARIRAFYVLERFDPHAAGHTECTIAPLSGNEMLAALLGQVSSGTFLLPSEVRRLMAMYARLAAQAPVRRVSFPNGFEHQSMVREQITADLEAAG